MKDRYFQLIEKLDRAEKAGHLSYKRMRNGKEIGHFTEAVLGKEDLRELSKRQSASRRSG